MTARGPSSVYLWKLQRVARYIPRHMAGTILVQEVREIHPNPMGRQWPLRPTFHGTPSEAIQKAAPLVAEGWRLVHG
jgi:hypothetical protein